MARDGTAVIRASDRVGQRGGGPAENLGFLHKCQVAIEIDHGRMDPADAEAARATLGEG